MDGGALDRARALRRKTTQWLALTGLALVAAIVWLTTQTASPPRLRRIELSSGTWSAYVAGRQGVARARDPEAERLVEAFVAMNRAEVAAQRADAPSVTPAVLAWEAAAREFAQTRTADVFLDVGRDVGLQFVERLDAWLKACAAQGQTATTRLAEHSLDSAAAQAYVDLGGLFIEFAERGGFVEGGVLVERRKPLLLAVFLHHWGRAVSAQQPLSSWMSADERAWLLRWRTEWQLDADVDRRIAAALELAAVPGYPSAYNAAVLALEAGRPAEALRLMGDSADSDANDLREAAERALSATAR